MYLYLTFGVLAIFSFLDILIERENRPNYYGITFTLTVLFLFIISAFRLERGTDWITYASYFGNFADSNYEGWMEPGFTFLNRAAHFICGNYAFMVFVTAVIIYSIKPRIIYKLAPYPFLVLLTWYSISIADIFPVRQTIASVFIIYSIPFIVRRKLIPFLFCVVLAFTFHASAFIFVAAYFIFNIRISRFWGVTFFVSSFILAFLAESVLSDLLGMISNPFIQERIEGYLAFGADNTFGSIYSTKEVLIRGFINRGMIIALIFLLLNPLRKTDKTFNLWVNMFVFGSIGFAFLTAVNVALGRLTIYFDLAQIFIFAYIFKLKMDRANKMLFFAIIVLYLLYRFYGVMNNYYDLYVPYKSLFWNSDMNVIL